MCGANNIIGVCKDMENKINENVELELFELKRMVEKEFRRIKKEYSLTKNAGVLIRTDGLEVTNGKLTYISDEEIEKKDKKKNHINSWISNRLVNDAIKRSGLISNNFMMTEWGDKTICFNFLGIEHIDYIIKIKDIIETEDHLNITYSFLEDDRDKKTGRILLFKVDGKYKKKWK